MREVTEGSVYRCLSMQPKTIDAIAREHARDGGQRDPYAHFSSAHDPPEMTEMVVEHILSPFVYVHACLIEAMMHAEIDDSRARHADDYQNITVQLTILGANNKNGYRGDFYDPYAAMWPGD